MTNTKRLTRIQQRARKELENSFQKNFKALAKAKGWGFRDLYAFKKTGQWYLYLFASIYKDEVCAHVSISIKPYHLDDIMCSIISSAGKYDAPLSYRACSGLSGTVPFEYIPLPPEGPINAMIDAAEGAIVRSEEIAKTFTFDDYLNFEGEFKRNGSVSSDAVATHILKGDLKRARELVQIALQNGDRGRTIKVAMDGKMISFFELADHWLSSPLLVRTNKVDPGGLDAEGAYLSF